MATFIATPSLPKVTLSATAAFVGTSAEFSLLAVTLSASMTSGAPFSAAFPLKVVSLTSDMLAGLGFSAEFRLPVGSVSATLLQQALFTGAFTLPRTHLDTQFYPGMLFVSEVALPIRTLEAVLRASGLFTAAFTLPAEQLNAMLLTAASAAYRTWALNLHKNALTEYDNFDFDSYASFNGVVLACNASGVVVLGTQATDGSTAIAATALTGMQDFESSMHKRVPRIYIDGSQNGDMHFKAITREGGTRTYLLPWNNTDEHTQRRVPVGKGPRSRFFQFGIENVAGADFSTQSLVVHPTTLRRRVS